MWVKDPRQRSAVWGNREVPEVVEEFWTNIHEGILFQGTQEARHDVCQDTNELKTKTCRHVRNVTVFWPNFNDHQIFKKSTNEKCLFSLLDINYKWLSVKGCCLSFHQSKMNNTITGISFDRCTYSTSRRQLVNPEDVFVPLVPMNWVNTRSAFVIFEIGEPLV